MFPRDERLPCIFTQDCSGVCMHEPGAPSRGLVRLLVVSEASGGSGRFCSRQLSPQDKPAQRVSFPLCHPLAFLVATGEVRRKLGAPGRQQMLFFTLGDLANTGQPGPPQGPGAGVSR